MFSKKQKNNIYYDNLSDIELNKLKSFQLRIDSTRFLRALKDKMTYREMSKIFDIPIPLLSRYASGKTLPNLVRAEKILTTCLNNNLLLTLIRKEYLFQNSSTINPEIIYFLSSYIIQSLFLHNINKVIAFYPENSLLGFSVALNLGSKLVYAYNDKYFFPDKRIEMTYSIKSKATGGEIKRRVCIPKGSIRNEENILVVGDKLTIPEEYLALAMIIKKINEGDYKNFVFIDAENKDIVNEFENKLNLIDKTFRVIVLKFS